MRDDFNLKVGVIGQNDLQKLDDTLRSLVKHQTDLAAGLKTIGVAMKTLNSALKQQSQGPLAAQISNVAQSGVRKLSKAAQVADIQARHGLITKETAEEVKRQYSSVQGYEREFTQLQQRQTQLRIEAANRERQAKRQEALAARQAAMEKKKEVAQERAQLNSQLKFREQFHQSTNALTAQAISTQKKITKGEYTQSAATAMAATPAAQLNERRRSREEALLGDGGASLFKIQAGLLKNYLIMNQGFQLLRFGSQFVVELDGALANLQAITATTNTQMIGLSKTIKDVSTTVRFTTVEVAQAATTMGQAGFSAAEISESIGAVTLLATATGTDLATSVDVATSAITVFGLRASEMTEVANVLTGATNLTKLTMDKVALGIQYAGNIAHEAGMNLNEMVAVLGAMSNAGIRSGSTLGTGLRQVITELMSPSKKLTERLSELGLSVSDVDVKANGFVNVLQTLRKAGFSTADAFEVFELRAAAAFAAMSRSPETINKLQQALMLSDAAAKANEVQMESLNLTIINFKNNLGLFIDEAMKPFSETLKVVLKGLSNFLNMLRENAAAAQILGTVITSLLGAKLIGGIGLLTINLLGLGQKIGGVAAVGTAASTVLGVTLPKAISVALRFLGPMGLAISALTLGIGFFLNTLDKTADVADKSKAAVDELQGQYDYTTKTITAVDESMQSLLNRYNALSGDSSALSLELLNLQTRFGENGFTVRDVLNPAIDDLLEGLQKVREEMAMLAQMQALDKLTLQWKNLIDIMNQQRENQLGSVTKGFSRGLSEKEHVIANRNAINSRRNEVQNTIEQFRLQLESNEDASTETLNQITQDAVAYRSELAAWALQTRSRIRELKNSTDEVSKAELKRLEIMLKDNEQFIAHITQVASLASNRVVDIQDSILKSVEASPLAAILSKQFIGYQTDFIELKKKIDDEMNVEGPINYKLLEGLKGELKQLELSMVGLVTNVSEKVLQQAIQEIQRENPNVQLEDLKAGLQNIHEGRSIVISEVVKAQKSIETSFEDAAKATEETNKEMRKKRDEARRDRKEALNRLQAGHERMFMELDASFREMERAVNDNISNLQNRSSFLDLIKSESEDPRSPIYGRYNDADRTRMSKEQRDNRGREVQARLNSLPGMISNYDDQIKTQGRVISDYSANVDSEDPESLNRVYEARAKLFELEGRRRDLLREKINLEQEHLLLQGQSEYANVSMRQQLEETLVAYKKNMEVQGTWKHDLETNVISVLDTAKNSFAEFATNIVTGSQSIGDSFRSMADNILKEMLRITTNKFAAQMMSGLFGGTETINWNQGGTSTVSSGGGWLGSIGKILGFNGGGIIKANGGAYIGRDNQLVLAQPGEAILRRSAVDMMGKENFKNINAMGNRRISDSAANISGMQEGSGGPTILNVYVVSPEEKPSLTRNDVIVTITEDMARGGSTKKLVKSIVAGM